MTLIGLHPRKLLTAIGLIATTTLALAQSIAPNPVTNDVKRPVIPKGKEADIKFYAASAGVVMGRDALAQMSRAGLVLWLAGNQFFAMDDVIDAFQKQHPATNVGLITLPPGLLLQAIKAGGWIPRGQRISRTARCLCLR